MAIGYVGESGPIGDTKVPSLTLDHASSAGNTLAVFVVANSFGATGEAACKVSSVIDDAHNIWHEGVTRFAEAATGAPYTSIRVAIWYCDGAAAITKLTVSMSQIVDSMIIGVAEASGLTNASPVDISNSGEDDSSAGWSATGTTVNAADMVFAVAGTGNSDLTFQHTADTWNVLHAMVHAPLDANDGCQMISLYKILAAAGAQSTAFTLDPAGVEGWCVLALKGGTVDTTNPNPRWPQVVHEIGFGVDPNDPDAVESWTDVTTRVNAFTCRRGRDYELARTEAGEAETRLNNWDGALDPMNASSPYSPNVRVMTPYRIRATWNGQLYRLITGYVERWPQRWEDERGTSRLHVVDGLATLACTQLEGAIGSEILADIPFAYWPLDDGALAIMAKNKAIDSSTPLSVATSANQGGGGAFAQDMTLQSEQGVCWRQYKTIAGDQYGACLVAPMTLPQLADGIVVECWARFTSAAGPLTYTLLALKGTAFAANALHRIALLTLDSVSGQPTLNVSDNTGALQAYIGSASGFNDSAWHHYVVHATETSARLWVDGVLRASGTPGSVAGSSIDFIEVGGEVDAWSNQGIFAGDIAHVAVFEIAAVDERRVAERAYAGLNGFPERSGARISRLLNYANWTAGRAIDEGLAFLGAASTIAKQTLLAAAQDVASWENGLVFVDGSGYLRFVDRFTRYNQSVRWTFGENEAGGEIPYETDVEIDYDPRYIYNDITVTKAALRLPITNTVGSLYGNLNSGLLGPVITGASSAHKRDNASVRAYFQRSLDKSSGVNSVSQCNAEADWLLANYKDPRARLARITITPSANPDLWPVALGVEIGDLVTVKRRPFGGGDTISLNCYVEQVSHQVQPGEWKVVLSLSPELLSTYAGQSSWVLNVSVLGIDTIVGAP